MIGIKQLNESPNKYYRGEYYDDLLEYIGIIGNKHLPLSEYDYECGYYISKTVGVFADRYFQNKIDLRPLNIFLSDKILIETIEMMGYDVHKFWYLCLFIKDFSYGFAVEGINTNNTSREQISKLLIEIFNNSKFNEVSQRATFNESMSLTLKVGKSNTTLNDSNAIFNLARICFERLEELPEKNDILDTSITKLNGNSLEESYEPLSNSVQIWYFTKIFLSFFELKPPEVTKRPKGSNVSLNKRLLISNLVFIMRLTYNKKFYDSETYLNGFFKLYKNKNFQRTNLIYL